MTYDEPTEACGICGNTEEEHVPFVMAYSPEYLARPIEPLPGGPEITSCGTPSVIPLGWSGEADLTGRDKATYVKSKDRADYYVVCYSKRREGEHANFGNWLWLCRTAISDPCDADYMEDISS